MSDQTKAESSSPTDASPTTSDASPTTSDASPTPSDASPQSSRDPELSPLLSPLSDALEQSFAALEQRCTAHLETVGWLGLGASDLTVGWELRPGAVLTVITPPSPSVPADWQLSLSVACHCATFYAEQTAPVLLLSGRPPHILCDHMLLARAQISLRRLLAAELEKEDWLALTSVAGELSALPITTLAAATLSAASPSAATLSAVTLSSPPFIHSIDNLEAACFQWRSSLPALPPQQHDEGGQLSDPPPPVLVVDRLDRFGGLHPGYQDNAKAGRPAPCNLGRIWTRLKGLALETRTAMLLTLVGSPETASEITEQAASFQPAGPSSSDLRDLDVVVVLSPSPSPSAPASTSASTTSLPLRESESADRAPWIRLDAHVTSLGHPDASPAMTPVKLDWDPDTGLLLEASDDPEDARLRLVKVLHRKITRRR